MKAMVKYLSTRARWHKNRAVFRGGEKAPGPPTYRGLILPQHKIAALARVKRRLRLGAHHVGCTGRNLDKTGAMQTRVHWRRLASHLTHAHTPAVLLLLLLQVIKLTGPQRALRFHRCFLTLDVHSTCDKRRSYPGRIRRPTGPLITQMQYRVMYVLRKPIM